MENVKIAKQSASKALGFLPLIFLLMFSSQLYGQKIKNIPAPSMSVEDMQAIFPEQDFTILLSKHHFTFERQEEGTPQVREQVMDLYWSLKNDQTLADVIFFDNETQIDYVRGIDQKGKKRKVLTAESAYQSDGVFHSDSKICEVFYEGMQKGERMGLLHQKTIKDVKYLTSVYFQSSLPIFERIISFEIPDWMDVELVERNFEGYDVKKTVDRSKDASIHTFSFQDVPPRKEDIYLPGPTHSLPHILVLSKGYANADGQRLNLLSSTADLYNWYRTLVSSVDNDLETVRPLVAQIKADSLTKRELAETMFYWVQENIRYIAFHEGIAGFKPAAAQDVCKDRFGDCKGMANLLKQMLMLEGMDARLSWLGTRHIAYDYSLPSLAVDNHMICTLFLDGDTIFLDPTEKAVAFGNCAHRIQGRPVLIEDGEDYLLSRIPEVDAESNASKYKISLSLDGKQIDGKADFAYNGEARLWIDEAYSYIQQNHKEDALKAYVTTDEKNMIVKEISTSDLQDRSAAFEIDFDFQLHNQVIEVGDELYVGMDLYQDFAALQIDSSRQEDVILPYKMSEVYDVELQIPNGYDISYLPKDYRIEHEDFEIELGFEQKEGRVRYTKKISLKEGKIRTRNFDDWNESLRELRQRYEDKVILKRQ